MKPLGDWRNSEIPEEFEAVFEMSYQWNLGEAMSHFLTTMRDHKKFLGGRCPACQRLLVPIRKYCERCLAETTAVEVEPEGILRAFTVVYRVFPNQPRPPPYTIAAIRLKGADTDFIHLMRETDPSRLFAGMRVKPVWSEDRGGDIFDVRYFEPY